MGKARVLRPLQSVAFRFAAVTLVPILALGWFVSSEVRTAIERRSGEVYGGMTSLMFRLVSDYLVTPGDFEKDEPLADDRAKFIDDLIGQFGVGDEQVRVRFVAPSGTVIYANRSGEAASVARTPEFEAALDGTRSSVFTVDDDGFGPRDQIIEMYIPVRFDSPTDGAGDKVHGVLIASGIDGSIIAKINGDVRRMQTSLIVGLAALWLVLMPIAWSLSRRLRRKSEENEHLALHDNLTGLPNRNLLAARLDEEIEAAERSDHGVGLLLIDLDRFKEVNDTLGHGKGDELLVAVAERLSATVRPVDMVARLGGDEFAVVVHGLSSSAELEEIAERVTAGLSGAADVGGIDVALSASIGGALYPLQAASAEELLRHADIAMYAAKDAGLEYSLYSAGLDSHSPSRLAMAAELLKALENDEFVLHFQPVASPLTGEVTAVEALVRWNHPTRGLVLPLDFIPLAEQSGLIRQLTTKVLDLAVAEAASWSVAGRPLPVAVNLSANDLRTHAVVDDVARTLDRHGVPGHLLQLEVTETALLDAPGAVGIVDRLRLLGVRIALDDFGTGYSSLTYLKQLRPAALKIDRSFVHSMTRDAADAEIVRSVVELAHRLSIGVTAEGVETEEHWRFLAELGCDTVQGYFLARPLPAPELAAWLAARATPSPLVARSSHN